MASALWHASGNSFLSSVFVLLLLLCPHSSTARKVIDAPLPQQDHVPSLPPPPPPPPPGDLTTARAPKCDQKFVSTPDGLWNGTFHAPTLINPDRIPRQCVYTFLAGPRQRVELIFNSFGLRGKPPDGSAVGELPACIHEYMDIYAEIRSENVTMLVETPFGGRYCGPIPPRRRVSLYQGLALSFYTDKNITLPNLFGGIFNFINATQYEIGTPVTNTPCSFTINALNRRSGSMVSPTYPGAYPKDLICTYQFTGQRGQRVRLEFRDFDLYFGGPHCPLDYVKVYDGIDNSSAIIGTYCGQQRNLVLYSSEPNLYVLFVTLERTANTQNRGFRGIFEFSESFVSLDFITQYHGQHIRGSECDQKILSRKETSGFVVSPNFPFPYIPKVVCRYFIYGMQDAQHLERVRLEFLMFTIQNLKGDACTDGYLKLYLKGQETTDSYDKFDYEMCGNKSNPSLVISNGPRLVMVFSSGEFQAKGFKAKYKFETEYKIPGTAAPDGSCTFRYRSSSRKRGEFNSPRYPSNYPSDTNCTYFFLATPNEQVALIFDYFKVRTNVLNTTFAHYGYDLCQDDWLEIYNMYRDDTEKLVGRYCGTTAPGPVESNLGALGLKVILHSDSELVYNGFKARYNFEIAKPIFGDCGSNISSLNYGIITSPNYPNQYDGPAKNIASKTCNWFIRVRPNQQILLNFEDFSVEGLPAERGCPAAVLRIWHSLTSEPIELCGVASNWGDKTSFLSEDNNMRLSFISSDKAVGQQGFRAVWTEVSTDTDCEDQFLCSNNKYCIDESLRCNNIDNCGPGDTSDEENCVAVTAGESYAVFIGYAVGSIFVALVLCLFCYRKFKAFRARNMPIDELPEQIDDRHYCFHHHDLLQQHHQDHSHSFDQYQLERPSSSSESEPEIEIVAEAGTEGDQETSSPDSG